MSVAVEKTVSWLFFALNLPESWEMTRYGLDRTKGNCGFADETLERLRLSWSKTDRPTGVDLAQDLIQRLKDCRRQLEDTHKDLEIGDIVRFGAWQVFEIKGTRPALVAARYLCDGTYLCEAEINTLPEDGADLGMAVLNSLRPRDKGVWKAYHLDFVLDDEWVPEAAKVYPGSTQLDFACDARSLCLFSINAKAMETTLEGLVGSLMMPQERILARTQDRFAGHEVLRVDTSCLAGRGLMGRLRRVRDYTTYLGWECRRRSRPRFFLVRFRRSDPVLGLPESFRFMCCEH
jgi:hypothetical protein